MAASISSFTEAYKEALAQATADIVFIETITVTHSLFPAPFRIAKSEIDFVDGGDTYVGGQFSIKLPDVRAASSSGISISLSDVDFAITSLLDAVIESLEPIEVLYKTFMNTEVGPQAQFEQSLETTEISMPGRNLSMTANYPDLINKKVPANKYTTTDFPGLR